MSNNNLVKINNSISPSSTRGQLKPIKLKKVYNRNFYQLENLNVNNTIEVSKPTRKIENQRYSLINYNNNINLLNSFEKLENLNNSVGTDKYNKKYLQNNKIKKDSINYLQKYSDEINNLYKSDESNFNNRKYLKENININNENEIINSEGDLKRHRKLDSHVYKIKDNNNILGYKIRDIKKKENTIIDYKNSRLVLPKIKINY